MTDVVTSPGGAANNSLQLVTCDQVTVTGDGSTERPLVATAAAIADGNKGDITVSGGAGSVWTVNAGAVTLAKQADLAADSIQGRANGAGAGAPQALTGAQVNVILPAATAILKGLVPTPPNSVAQVLRGDATWGAVPAPDPLTGTRYFDDFLGFGGIGNGSSGGGADPQLWATPPTNRPGVAELQVESQPEASVIGQQLTSSGGGTLDSNGSGLIIGGGAIDAKAAVSIPGVSSAGEDFVARFGLAGAGQIDSTTPMGIFLEYDLIGNGSPNWFLCAADGGAPTKVDTGIAVVIAATFLDLAIAVNAAGTSATCSIDGVAGAAPVAATLPTGPIALQACMRKDNDTAPTIQAMRIDWWSLDQTFTVPR